MIKIALPMVMLLLYCSQGFAQTSQERIEQGAVAFEQAYASGDAEGLANFYTDDAVLMLPDGQRIVGKEAITAYYRNGAEAGVKDLDVQSVEWFESGDLALDVGDYAITQPDGGRSTGQFVVVMQRNDEGNWRFHRLIWNAMP